MGITENDDGSININITDSEWEEYVKEQEELEKQFNQYFDAIYGKDYPGGNS